jgi:hypothetical protein
MYCLAVMPSVGNVLLVEGIRVIAVGVTAIRVTAARVTAAGVIAVGVTATGVTAIGVTAIPSTGKTLPTLGIKAKIVKQVRTT